MLRLTPEKYPTIINVKHQEYLSYSFPLKILHAICTSTNSSIKTMQSTNPEFHLVLGTSCGPDSLIKWSLNDVQTTLKLDNLLPH